MYKHMQTFRDRCKCTSRRKLRHVGKHRDTNPNTLTYVNIQGYKNMQVLEEKNTNTKTQRHANACWVIFTHEQLTWSSPILAGSFPFILSTGPNIDQSYNLSHIHAHMCLREVIPRSSHCSCQHKFSISQSSLSQKDKTKSRVAWYVFVHVSI